MKSLLGKYLSSDFPFGRVAASLNAKEEANGIQLSPYGYVMWAVEHHGSRCAFVNVMASESVISGYAGSAVEARDTMPELVYNAHLYVSKLLSNVADMDTCFKQLEGMTFPYVLYIMFAGSGQQDVVARYKTAAIEQLKRYPSTCDKLPESFRKVAEELKNADTDQA